MFLAAAFLMVFAVSPVWAEGDEGLYDPVPPEGSIFVRFIHAQADITSEIIPEINGRERDGARFGAVKPYGVTDNGKVEVGFGKYKGEFEAEADGYYSVILQDGKLRFEQDPSPKDALKAQIIFYNLTGRDDISLRTADGKITVAGPLDAGAMQDRAINPIKVSFAVFVGDEKFADLNDWPLERGESYTIAVMEDTQGKGVTAYERARTSEE
jgi:alginate O-acetyltransferase complex protein AlgF